MRRLLFGIASLTLLALTMVACTDAPADRTGQPAGDKPPAASPTTPPSQPSTGSPPATTPPASSPSSPSTN